MFDIWRNFIEIGSAVCGHTGLLIVTTTLGRDKEPHTYLNFRIYNSWIMKIIQAAF